MIKRPAIFLFFALGAILAGCGGGKGAPMLPAAPAPTSSAGPQSSAKSSAKFVVTVPLTTPAPLGAKRPAYVSPATQSMTVAVMQGSSVVLSQIVGLTANSAGCTSSLSGITCTLTFNLNPGSYTASITTYDSTNATGNALSTAQNVSFKVNANQNNLIPLSLSGIPAKIVALSAPNNAVYVVAQDADGNFIVGSGAPVFAAAPTSTSPPYAVTINQPTSTAPNTISFTPSSPAVYGTETIGVTASYPSGQTNACTESGAVCTLANPISVSYGSVLFVDNYENSTLIGFTLPFTSSAQSPAYSFGVGSYPDGGIGVNPANGDVFAEGYESPFDFVAVAPPYTTAITNSQSGNDFDYPYGPIAAAPNGDVFVPNTRNNSVAMFVPPYTAAATQITNGVFDPYAAAADSNNNLYVGNYTSSTTGTITAYASPYTGAPYATVSTTSTPESIAISGTTLVVGENSAVDVFSLPLLSGAPPIATWSTTDAYAVAFDPTGNIWFACYEACSGSNYGEIFEYKKGFSSAESPSVQLTMPAAGFSTDYPAGIGFDATGNLYVQNYEGGAEEGGVLEYSGTITSSSSPTIGVETSTFDYPWGMAIAPAQLVVTP